jgi:hypothetical protein
MIWFGAVCDLLAGRFVSTTGSPSLSSMAGLEECQTPSLGVAWQFVLGPKMIALYTLIEDLNGSASELIYFSANRYSLS